VPGARPPLRLVPGGRDDAPAGTGSGGDEADHGPHRPRGSEPASRSGLRAARELIAAGTGLVLTFVLMAQLGAWTRSLGTFQSLYAVGFVFFALALARAGTRAIPRAGLIVFAVALASRLALLPVTPTLSDDLYRYIWEGRVAAQGGDPWRASPGDSSLARLRDRAIHPRINHPELAAIYPPLAVAGFAVVSSLSPTVMAMKIWVLLHDLALVLALIAWTRRRGLGAQAVIAYAWNPLVVVEYAGSGHHDPTALVWLVAALMWAERRPALSALALAIGVLTRLAPLAALPFLMPRWPWRARLIAMVPIALGLGWYWSRTRGAESGLGAYWRTWSNNELAFGYLEGLVGGPMAARAVALGLVIALVAFLAWRGHGAPIATGTTMRAGFLLSPVAHPWYLGWVLALAPITSPASSAPWLLLSLTAVLSYGVLTPPIEGSGFHLPLGWRWVEYGLPLLLATGIAAARWPARRTAGARS